MAYFVLDMNVHVVIRKKDTDWSNSDETHFVQFHIS